MAVNYTTFDYFRDNFWLFDVVFRLMERFGKGWKLFLKNFTNFDFDFHLFRIIENLPYGIFILFLGFFFTIFLVRQTEGEYGIKVFSITTNSMYPAIVPGSLLFSIPTEKYSVGDVITYKEKSLRNEVYTGRILTHRIIAISVSDGFYNYTVKGDNNENPDPGIVKTKDIRGKVFINLPFLGYVDCP